MRHSVLILVSDDHGVIESAKSFACNHNLEIETYSMDQWKSNKSPQLSVPFNEGSEGGSSQESEGGTVLPFRAGRNKVCTINELESVAIRNAIFAFNGNLTEASKALGIGRATLYRKVKQYNIDPTEARRRAA